MAELILAQMADLQAWDFWRNSDPKSRGPAPERIPRPGVTSKAKENTHHSVRSLDRSEMDAWLASRGITTGRNSRS